MQHFYLIRPAKSTGCWFHILLFLVAGAEVTVELLQISILLFLLEILFPIQLFRSCDSLNKRASIINLLILLLNSDYSAFKLDQSKCTKIFSELNISVVHWLAESLPVLLENSSCGRQKLNPVKNYHSVLCNFIF